MRCPLGTLKAFVGEDGARPNIDPAEAELVETRLIKHDDLVEASQGIISLLRAGFPVGDHGMAPHAVTGSEID
jgi:hypothetical protein